MTRHRCPTRCGPQQIYVRFAHTVLSLGVLTALIFQDSDLHHWFTSKIWTDWLCAVAFLLLFNVALVMYWVTCMIDPGYVPINRQNRYDDSDEEAGEGMMEAEHTLNNGVKLRRCGFCGIEQPLRARHCEDCDRCVSKFDHHCPWLETCVGEQNHKFFFLFLMFELALILWALRIAWLSIHSAPLWIPWLRTNVVTVLALIVLAVACFVVGSLFAIHGYLMATNQTTWEAMARQRITYLKRVHYTENPFHEGYCRNIARFLCYWGRTSWEGIYNRNVGKKDITMHVKGDEGLIMEDEEDTEEMEGRAKESEDST